MKITQKEKQYLLQRRSMASLLELAAFADLPEFDENSVEAFNFKALLPDFKKITKKMGLHVKKGDGLLQILFKSGKHIAKLVWLLLKYTATQDENVKDQLKEKIRNTRVTPAQFLDFVLRLDTITLHAFTGPIHILDAIMGWHIGADLKHAAQDAGKAAKDAFKKLKKAGDKLSDTSKQVFDVYMKKLSSLIFRPQTAKGT